MVLYHRLILPVSIHPPRVGRDNQALLCPASTSYFNPPSPCGEGLASALGAAVATHISIHPPRVGRDEHGTRVHALSAHFNPPSPCGEGPARSAKLPGNLPFQSTLPVWGGTRIWLHLRLHQRISIHPPRVGRDPTVDSIQHMPYISIHPPRVGRDVEDTWGDMEDGDISIHPPRVGRDMTLLGISSFTPNFNPPSPCGEGRRS